jgi:hypothetical protein
MGIAETIMRLTETVARDEHRFGVFSTGEKIAVALVLDRRDLLAEVNGGYTMLEAVERLGPEWTSAALQVQRARS